MPSIESFDEETLVAHTLSSAGQCLTMEKDKDGVQKLFLEDCKKRSKPRTVRNQARLTKWGDLRLFDRRCLDWGYTPIKFDQCHTSGGNQATGYDIHTGMVFNKNGRRWCLGVYSDSSQFIEKGPCISDKVDNLDRTFVVSNFTFLTVFDKELLVSSSLKI